MSDTEQTQHEEASAKRRMPASLNRYLLKVQGGKFYLPAAFRLVWFRDECPEWGVETEITEGGQEAGFATVKATIYNEANRLIATGHKTETRQDFPAGWVEKAETGAVARALAIVGFGTQFSEDLDEGMAGGEPRYADSPQGRANGGQSAASTGPREVWAGPGPCPSCGAPPGKIHATKCGGPK